MGTSSHPRTCARSALACLLALATLSGLAPAVGAQDGTASGSGSTSPGAEAGRSGAGSGSADTSAQPDEREVAEATVASLRRDRDEVRAELASASSARNQQFDEWALNHLALERAQNDVIRTVMLAEKGRRDVVAAENRLKSYAADAFMNPPAFEAYAVLSIRDADKMSWAHDVLSISADDQNRVVDELEEARRGAERAAQAAEVAAGAAEERAAKAKAELEELEVALRRQQQLAAEVDGRLEGALSEVEALKAVDAAAAADLAEQETQLAEESRASVAADTEERPSGRSGSPARASTPAPKPKAPSPPPPPPSNIVTWQDVTKVGTFWVHRSIAGQVRSMLDSASAAGFSLSGGGFRDPAEQIRLRQAHCGPTQYDIYEKPASQCTPPTAQPGRSMHERGLALDIKSSGKLITSRADPAFAWLSANASRFGFYNLPSEPWHWSVNGT